MEPARRLVQFAKSRTGALRTSIVIVRLTPGRADFTGGDEILIARTAEDMVEILRGCPRVTPAKPAVVRASECSPKIAAHRAAKLVSVYREVRISRAEDRSVGVTKE